MRRASIIAAILALACAAATARAQGPQQLGWTEQLTGPRARAQLSAPEPEARRRAARTLGRHGAHEPAVRALSDALRAEQDPTVRRAIAGALARRGDTEAVPALVDALRSGAEPNRAVVADALGALGTDAAVRALVEALGSQETAPLVREPILRTGVRAVPHLMRALRDRSSAPHAARLLGRLGDPVATPRLVALATAEQSPIAVAALDALATSGDDRAADAVASHLRSPSPDVRRAALRALAALGDARHGDAVAEVAREGEPADRRVAARTLLHVDPPRGAKLLEAWARSDDARLVRHAADLALETPHPALVPLLYGLLREGSRAAHAASALAAVDGGAGVPVLLREATGEASPSAPVARALAVALRTWPDALSEAQRRRGRRALRALDEGLRGLLLRALARDPAVGSELVGRLDDDDPVARATAALGLEMLGAPAHGAAVAERLASEEHPEAFRRMASAAVALEAPVPARPPWRRLEAPATAPEAMRLAARALDGSSRRTRRRLRELMRRQLRAEDPRVRAGAARALAEAGEDSAWRALATRLDDDAPEVRLAAARALQTLAVRDADSVLRAHWRTENDARVRTAIEDALRAPMRAMPRPFEAVGRQVLHVRIVSAGQGRARGVGADVVLPDGRWLRMRTLPSGELFLPDLPAGDADVRVRVGAAP